MSKHSHNDRVSGLGEGSVVIDDQQTEEPPRQVSVSDHNCSVAWTPFPVTVMKPFAPFVAHSDPFVSKSLWREAVNGIKALKRLKLAVGDTKKMRAELLLATGHTMGHLMVVNADNYSIMQKATHYNHVTLHDLVVTNTMIYTLVERDAKHGTAADDCEVFVWDINTFESKFRLSAHEERVTSIAVDEADECRVVTGSVDKMIYLWRIDPSSKDEPQPIGKMSGHQMSVTKLLISKSLLISSSADSTVRVWDLNTLTCIKEMDGHQGSVCFLNWVSVPTIPEDLGATAGGTKKKKQSKNLMEESMLLAETTSSPAALLDKALKEKDGGAAGFFISACASGIVRYYAVEGHHVVMHWTNKAHKGMITDVVWDSDVVVSSSASDGLNVYNLHNRRNVKYVFADGIRQLAMDTTRKLVIAGADSGQLVILDYNGVVHPTAAAEGLSIFTTIQPHQGSITSLVLERSGNGQWERVITASNDRTIFVLDFDVDRDSRSVTGGHSGKNIVIVGETGTMISASESYPILWDPVEMVRKSDAEKNRALQGAAGHKARARINAMVIAQPGSVRGSPGGKLLTGADDGQLRIWDIEVQVEGVHAAHQSSLAGSLAGSTTTREPIPRNTTTKKVDPSCGEESITTATVLEFGANIKAISEPVEAAGGGTSGLLSVSEGTTGEGELSPLVAVALHKGGLATQHGGLTSTKVGSVAVVNYMDGTLVGGGQPLPTLVFPVSVQLHSYIHPETNIRSFTVLAQLRDGSVVMFGGDDNHFAVQRTIQSEHFSYSMERDMEGVASPWPVTMRSKIFVQNSVARVEMLTVDHSLRNLKCAEVTTLAKDTSGGNLRFSTSFESTVNDIKGMYHGNLFAVVATENSNAYIVGKDGEILYDILYSGAVVDVAKENRNAGSSMGHFGKSKAVTVFQSTASLGDRLPGCATIATSEGARVVALGYRDGLVQLWDMTQRKVCRRIHAHINAIVSCWILPDQLRLASVSVGGSLRFDTIYQRNVRDSSSDGPAQIQMGSRTPTPIPEDR